MRYHHFVFFVAAIASASLLQQLNYLRNTRSVAASYQPRALPALSRTGHVTAPLHSTAALLNWSALGQTNSLNSAVPLPPFAAAFFAHAALHGAPRPLVLIAHDFHGNYHAWDARADGARGDELPAARTVWRFNHWAYVDVFVYFSHHRVTIPPAGYIAAAHRHGAQALGTLVFEWADGARDLLAMLHSPETMARAAAQLAAIAAHHGFDGWLLNIEVMVLDLPPLSETIGPSLRYQVGPALATRIAAFIELLKLSMRERVGDFAQVVWYDSIRRDGLLNYQNELNEHNELFFDFAGSLFTDYKWDADGPPRSAKRAGERRFNVYTGVDVVGRRTQTGSGFATHKSLRAIAAAPTSVALFAPAWTVMACGPTADCNARETRFWTGKPGNFGRQCVAQYVRERAAVTELPFRTTFDPGWGARDRRYGRVVDARRYFSMARQAVQPSFMRSVPAAGEADVADLEMSEERSFMGSTSVKVSLYPDAARTGFVMLRLFVANVSTKATPTPTRVSRERGLRVSFTYLAEKLTGPRTTADDIGLALLFSPSDMLVVLVGKGSKWGSGNGSPKTFPPITMLGRVVTVKVLTATSDRPSLAPALRKRVKPTGWRVRSFTLPKAITSKQNLTEVMVVAGSSPTESVRSLRRVERTALSLPNMNTTRSITQSSAALYIGSLELK